jgi:hypothetical protein
MSLSTSLEMVFYPSPLILSLLLSYWGKARVYTQPVQSYFRVDPWYILWMEGKVSSLRYQQLCEIMFMLTVQGATHSCELFLSRAQTDFNYFFNYLCFDLGLLYIGFGAIN